MPAETITRAPQESVGSQRPPITEGLDRALGKFRSEGRPMTKSIPDIHKGLQNSDTMIIEGQPGSGKTTVATLAILEHLLKTNPDAKVALTQPRRDAAKSLVTEDLNPIVGSDYVGYRIKGESTIKQHTRLEVMMEQSLENELLQDSLLKKYDAVIIDEPHLRGKKVDLLIAALKKTRDLRREMGLPFHIILLSATLDTPKYQAFLGESTLIQAEGRMHQIHDHFENKQVPLKDVPRKATEITSEIFSATDEGDVLIFVPGRGEIRKVMGELKKIFPNDEYDFLELTGGDKSNSKKIKREKGQKRAVFVATDVIEIAQTPRTIRFVIDSGFMRTATYDQKAQIYKRLTEYHTQGNSRQRRGRVGRVSEGWVYHLYSEQELNDREEHLRAAIFTEDLSPEILMFKGLGVENLHDDAGYIDYPGKENIDNAVKKLQSLGALDQDQKITTIGKNMLKIETDDPMFARIIVEAERLGCGPEVATLVGLLQSPSIFAYDYKRGHAFAEKYSDYVEENNDIVTIINIWNDYVKNGGDKSWAIDRGIKTSELENAVNNGIRMLENPPQGMAKREISTDPDTIQKIFASLFAGLKNNLVIPNEVGNRKFIGDLPITIDKNSSVSRGSYFLAGKFDYKEDSNATFAEYNWAIPQELAQAIMNDYSQEPNQPELQPKEAPMPEQSGKAETSREHAENENHESQDTQSIVPAKEVYNSTNLHKGAHEDGIKAHNAEPKRNFIQKIADKVKNFVDKILRALRIRR
jgi:HrpA-like RNA helicase